MIIQTISLIFCLMMYGCLTPRPSQAMCVCDKVVIWAMGTLHLLQLGQHRDPTFLADVIVFDDRFMLSSWLLTGALFWYGIEKTRYHWSEKRKEFSDSFHRERRA